MARSIAASLMPAGCRNALAEPDDPRRKFSTTRKPLARFSVTVRDATPPVLGGVPSTVTQEATSQAGAVATWTLPTAADVVDGSVPVICQPSSGSPFGFGRTTVTCTATDAHGNVGSASFDVVVQDTTPPVLAGVPSAITVEAASASGAVAVWTLPTATDLVSGPVGVTCLPASGTQFALGETVVSCSATDTHAQTATANFRVRVVDTTGPSLTLPTVVTAEASSPFGTTVTYSASATNWSADRWRCRVPRPRAAGSAIGATPVACGARDGAGNLTTGEFAVVVRDTTSPVANVISPSTDALFVPPTTSTAVVVHATDVVGVTAVTVNSVPASLESGTPQDGTWRAAAVPVTLPVPIGGALVFNVLATDAAANAGMATGVVDNDGISSAVPPTALAPFPLDRNRATGADESGVFSNDFNNGITSGTVARGGWAMTLTSLPAPPPPTIPASPSTASWPSAGWVQAAISGSGSAAVISACTGAALKQVVLTAAGQRVGLACDPVTGTIYVKALSAVAPESWSTNIRRPPPGSRLSY